MDEHDEIGHPLSSREIRDLAWSTLGLGIAFAIMFFAPATDLLSFFLSAEFFVTSVVSIVIVTISYIPHEMAHRVTARSMDAYAEYEMWAPGVVLAVVTAFLGVVFAATGGTRMHTRTGERYGLSVPELDIKMIGLVSLAGPLMNVSLAVLFSFLAVSVTGIDLYGMSILGMGATMNTLLALANLAPFYPMDGYKILRWNSVMWFVTVALAGLTFLL